MTVVLSRSLALMEAAAAFVERFFFLPIGFNSLAFIFTVCNKLLFLFRFSFPPLLVV